MIKNRQKAIYKSFLILTIFFIILLFIFITLIDASDFQYAGIVLSFFLSIVSSIITFIFFKRSKIIEKALEKMLEMGK